MHYLMAKIQTVSAQHDQGATAVEYGIMAALIAAVIVVAVTALGVQLNTFFTAVVF